MIWQLTNKTLPINPKTPLFFGIVNVTPDSFSGEGIAAAMLDQQMVYVQQLIKQGADVLDIGGESSRPGATPISYEEERKRLMPLVASICQQYPQLTISIDTTKPAIADEALQLGAHIINDINALSDPAMIEVCLQRKAGVIIMHKQGIPATMQKNPSYSSVVKEVCSFLTRRTEQLIAAGITANRIVIDPGIGFGKTSQHNEQLLQQIKHLLSLPYPVLMGVSRKRIISDLTTEMPPQQRDWGTAALTAWLALQGVPLHRVHNVKACRDAVTMALLTSPSR